MILTNSRGPITCLTLARTVFGKPLRTVMAFLLEDTLIDSGPPATARALGAWAHAHGVRRVVNTHHHEDHTGGNAMLMRAIGLPVWAPAATVPILQAFPRLEFYRLLVWGQPPNVKVQTLPDVFAIGPYRLEVIATPGHSPDHACLFEREQGWLFTGDLFIHERVRYLRADEDVCATVQSLRRMLALGPRLLVCSHAGFVEDACGALERKIAYFGDLDTKVQALRGSGLSVRQITERLLGREGQLAWISGGHFSKQNLIRSMLKWEECK